MKLESRKGPKKEKKRGKKTCFVNWKAYLSFFFITHSPLHFNDDF